VIVAGEIDVSSTEIGERRRFGMWLFLAALGMLFAGCLVGFVVIRVRASEWPPAGSPGLPLAFWLSTVLLVLISVLLIAAERSIGTGERVRTARLLSVSVLLGVAFVLSQASGWSRLVGEGQLPQENLFLFGVYVLTFLHVLHVLGGLVPLAWVALRSRAGRYSGDEHSGITVVAMYWHFLGVVWVGILAVLVV
jgi:heme/copper-type cytochrome/quinol oxidase subunit 3